MTLPPAAPNTTLEGRIVRRLATEGRCLMIPPRRTLRQRIAMWRQRDPDRHDHLSYILIDDAARIATLEVEDSPERPARDQEASHGS